MALRKVTTFIEETMIEATRTVSPTWRIVAVAAIIDNPCAGRYVEDLKPLVEEWSSRLGEILVERAIQAMGLPGDQITGVGKAALVGLNGEVEHGCAIIHTRKFGDVVRNRLRGSAGLVSVEKRGAAGSPVDIPLKHKDDHAIRSHHMTYEIRVPDGPRADEILIALAIANTGRPFARIGSPATDLK